MVEVLEYSLVFLASSLLIGFSVIAVGSFSNYSLGVENRAALSSLNSVAMEAVEQGSSNLTVAVAAARVLCAGGNLTLSSPYYSGSVYLPVGCHFDFSDLEGRRAFSFVSGGGQLSLEVR